MQAFLDYTEGPAPLSYLEIPAKPARSLSEISCPDFASGRVNVVSYVKFDEEIREGDAVFFDEKTGRLKRARDRG